MSSMDIIQQLLLSIAYGIPNTPLDANSRSLAAPLLCQTRIERCHSLWFMTVFATVRRLISFVIQTETVGIFHHKLHHLSVGFPSKELVQVLLWTPVADHDHFVRVTNSCFDLHTSCRFRSRTPDPEQISPHPEETWAIACQNAIDKDNRLWVFRQTDLVN